LHGASELQLSAANMPVTTPDTLTVPPRGTATPPGSAARAEAARKKKDKVRSAWISFAGRIIAQVVGAAASVTLGILVVQQYGATTASHAADTRARAAAVAPIAPRTRSVPGRLAIAVLPVENYSGNPADDHVADSLTEALITTLARESNVRVISRTSSMGYKGQHKPLTVIARELDVDLLVEGSIVRSRDRIRVVAQLIDGATDEHLWAGSHDRPLGDILNMEAEAATQIVGELVDHLPTSRAF
jgi:TolB-like protein